MNPQSEYYSQDWGYLTFELASLFLNVVVSNDSDNQSEKSWCHSSIMIKIISIVA